MVRLTVCPYFPRLIPQNYTFRSKATKSLLRGHIRVGMGSDVVAEQHMSQQTVKCVAATCLPFYIELSPISQ